MHVCFLHPDLGVGGAERLIVDAACTLKKENHKVEVVTAHYDPGHCFDETKDENFIISVAGDWLPRSTLGRCYAFWAYIRMIYAAFYVVFKKPDVIFVDQVSCCIPVLKWFSSAKVLFFCHYPDMLLTERKTLLKRLYRGPIDFVEERTTGMADKILVNSHFTAGVFQATFRSLQHIQPTVLYPSLNAALFDTPVENQTELLSKFFPASAKHIFLSINRYERKKNLPLAIKALGHLKQQGQDLSGVLLVMAGGYDTQVVENIEHYQELVALREKLGLQDHVTFHKSIKDAEKITLLSYSDCLLYTPDREHFGIVPVEAMYLKTPVIAVNTGGPLETIEDGVTGFLCNQTEEAFAEAMMKILADRKMSVKMGNAGRERVQKLFSAEAFRDQLNDIVTRM